MDGCGLKSKKFGFCGVVLGGGRKIWGGNQEAWRPARNRDGERAEGGAGDGHAHSCACNISEDSMGQVLDAGSNELNADGPERAAAIGRSSSARATNGVPHSGDGV